MNTNNHKIYVAGHRGMVGAAIVRTLQAQGRSNIVTRTHTELDLTNQSAVNAFFTEEQPHQVYLAAAKVGGIHANNTYPAEFIYENLIIEANVIHAAWQAAVNKLLFLGSSCIYSKLASQPMREDALLGQTHRLCNPGQVPVEIIEVQSGEYVGEDDIEQIYGEDLTIKALAEIVATTIGYEGEMIFDTSKPDGTMRKLMDVGILNTSGSQAKVRLSDGLKIVNSKALEKEKTE